MRQKSFLDQCPRLLFIWDRLGAEIPEDHAILHHYYQRNHSSLWILKWNEREHRIEMVRWFDKFRTPEKLPASLPLLWSVCSKQHFYRHQNVDVGIFYRNLQSNFSLSWCVGSQHIHNESWLRGVGIFTVSTKEKEAGTLIDGNVKFRVHVSRDKVVTTNM